MTEPSGGSSTKPRRPVVVPAVALVAATGLGITALLGGFDDRPDPAPPKLGAGQTLDQGQFETQFVESRYSEKKAENEFTKDKRFLDLVFKVTNKTDDAAYVGSPRSSTGGGGGFGQSVLKMTPVIKSQFGPLTFVQSRGATSSILQPGVPSTVIFRYELGPGVKPPTEVSLEVGTFEDNESAVDGTTSWMLASEAGFQDEKASDTVAATVTLPVKQGVAS
ncbi:hypothetical protein ACIBHX_41730 [Nonomuraea sp. NPDC050536]|uniref:hypothetical protein n=1 Tax=Nonomuraea sp. NPDC050536 TaxID=3364366 RepID=UPI0037CA406D